MPTSWRRLPLLVAAILLLSLGLAACGGDDDEADPTATTTTEATQPPAAEEPGGDAPDGDAAAGEAVWQAQCMACHTIDGAGGLGPTWQGLWMSEVTLTDGSTVTADAEYITESIEDPAAKLVEGYGPSMPQMNLTDEQIANVIAFIATLE